MAIRTDFVAAQSAATEAQIANIPNVEDELLIVFAIATINNGPDFDASLAAGWTTLVDNYKRSSSIDSTVSIFWKRAAPGGDTFPSSLGIDASCFYVTISVVVTDVDWSNGGNPFDGGIVQRQGNAQNGSHPSLTSTVDNVQSLMFVGTEQGLGQINHGGAIDTMNCLDVVREPSANTSGNNGAIGRLATEWLALSGDSTNYNDSGNNGDTLINIIGVRTLGNDVPAYAVIGDITDFDAVESPTFSTNGTPRDQWIDAVDASGDNFFTGDTIQTFTFDASSDVNTGTNEITITAHGLTSSQVVRLDAGGNTPPTGMVDGDYYWVNVIDDDTIQVRTVDGHITNDNEWFADASTIIAANNLSATGTGTMTLRDARLINAPAGQNNVDTPGGAGGNLGKDNWPGDAGWHVNYAGVPRLFSPAIDFSDDRILVMSMGSDNSNSNRTGQLGLLFIDGSNNWDFFKMADAEDFPAQYDPGGLSFGENTKNLLQPSKATPSRSGGSSAVDYSDIEWMVLVVRGNTANGSAQTFQGARIDDIFQFNQITFAGGSSSNPFTFADVFNLLTNYEEEFALSATPSQVALRVPVTIGATGRETQFVDGQSSLAYVPPDTDAGPIIHRRTARVGVTIDAPNAGDNVTYAQGQISNPASNEGFLDVSLAAAADLNLDNTSVISHEITLDGDFTYTGNLFVNPVFIVDNGAEIRGATITVGDRVGADAGVITFGATTDIQSSSFSLDAGTPAGHAIIITTPGTYSFSSLEFSNFGADGTATAAVYNNSGGAVTINVSGGNSPTVRNGVGASTTVNAGASITLTGVQPNSECRLYRGTVDNATAAVELDGVENSGTTVVLTHSDAGEAAYIVIASTDFQNEIITFGSLPASDQTIPVQQRTDRTFENP